MVPEAAGQTIGGRQMSSIRNNFLYNAAYQLLLILLPLITTPYISRVLGADRIGVYTYTYTVANYFMLVAMLGVKNYGNRSVAAVRDDRAQLSKTFWEIYGLQFFCSAIALIAYFIFIFTFEAENHLIFVIQSIYVFSGMMDISWLFFGLEKFKITVLRNIAVKLVSLGCIFLLVRTADDLWIYTLIMALGIFFSQGYLWLYVRRFVDWVRPTVKQMCVHLPAQLVLFIPVIAVSLYKMMDKIMLGQMSSYTQVGFYESAEKIINIPMGVITALGTVMLPRMSNLAAKSRVIESKRYIYNSMLFAVFLAAGMAFGIAGIAADFVPLFLGEEYLPSTQLLQMLTPTVLFIAWANVIRTQYLIPNHLDKSYIISVLLGAVVNLIINALLIPRMDAMGAVIGTVCAEGAVCLCQTLMVRKQLEIGRYLRDTLPFLLLGAGMYLLIQAIGPWLPGGIVTVAIQIVIGGGVYALASAVYLALTHPDAVRGVIQKITTKRGNHT